MDLINEKIQDYAELHTSPENPLLQKINRETNANFLYPRMLSGHLQGRILSMISKMVSPKLILEIGTYTGYSALCLAEGLHKEGKLITIDINEELEDKVNAFFKASDFVNQIEFRIGDARDIIPEIREEPDLVFIDADKENYSVYFELAVNAMRSGGYLIADNVLWSGKVLETPTKRDDETSALIKFNQQVQNDDRVENVLLPVRDGLMIIRKK